MTEWDEQRRKAIVLFADLQGSTPLAEQLEDEAFFDVIKQVHARILFQVKEHGGTVQEVQGDGVLALFGAPLAIEDAPLRACRAALDIQESIRRLADDLKARYGVWPQLRIGLHAGSVLLGDVGTPEHTFVTPLGDDVNLAARLQTAAEGGTILMTEALQNLVEGWIDSTPLGYRTFKGKSAPQNVYRLDRLKQGVSRFQAAHRHRLAALVGRDLELAVLDDAWRDACNGKCRIVSILGAAGIGKSRLIHEFQSRLDREDTFVLEGNCDPDSTNHPYLPFIDIVRNSFRIDPQSDSRDVAAKLRRGLTVLNVQPDEVLPYLLNLFGHAVYDAGFEALDPGIVGIRTRNAIRTLLRARCNLTPTVIFLEDLHWSDTATAELIADVATDHSLQRLLVVCTYRPEYAPSWMRYAGCQTVELCPLRRTMTDSLAAARLGVNLVPQALLNLIEEKAEGNPLFVEEILNYLLETSQLEQTQGQLRLHLKEETVQLPITLENMLMDRVDRLPGGTRRVLEAAAIMGRVFDVSILAQTVEMEDTKAHIEGLVKEDLISRRNDDRLEFKHALLRDAVYLSLLTPQRQALHEKVAAMVEDQHGNRLFEVADVLAHHYSHTVRKDKAVQFLAMAGEKSLRVYSIEEAETRLRQALELMETMPGAPDELFLVDVLLCMIRVHYFNADFFGIIALGDHYLRRVEALADKQSLARFLIEIGCAHSFATRHQTGKQLLERALRLAQESNDEGLIGYASMGLLQHYTWGEPASEQRRASARRLGEQALEIGMRLKDVWLASKALAALSTERAVWGRPDEARQYALQLFTLSENTGNPRPRCEGLYRLAYASASGGEYDEAIQYARESLTLSLSPVDRILARHPMALALILQGQRVEEGLALLDEVREEIRRGGFRIFELFVELPYGVAMVRVGKLAKGIRYIAETIERYSRIGQPLAKSYGHWMLGSIYLEIIRGGRSPSLSVVLRNVGFLLMTLPFKTNRARYHLKVAIEESRIRDIPAQLAKSLYDLGLLNELKERPEEARKCFEEARSVAKAIEADGIYNEIESKLAV